jgi:hypothetical protein
MLGGAEVIVVSGGVVSTFHLWCAALESVLPASSIARTRNLCQPSARGGVVYGVLHGDQTRASRLQWNVLGSVELNVNVACDDASVRLGPDVIVVCGATVSTVHVRVAGVGSGLAAASRARASNVCEPFARRRYLCGDAHASHIAASRRQSKVLDSLAPNENVALVRRVRSRGPPVIVVSGAAVSTVQVHSAGVGSRSWPTFLARTSNVCCPSARLEYVAGETHAANAAPSSAHSNLDPGSSEEKRNVALVLLLRSGGPESIVVAGASDRGV